QAEEDAGEDAEQADEAEDAPIGGEIEGDVAAAVRDQGDEDALAPDGEERSEQAAQDRKQDALGEQLADDAEAFGAERQTHANLFLASGSAGEEHAGEIDDSQQEHEADQREEGEQGLLEAAAQARGAGRAARKLELLGENVAAIRGIVRSRGLLLHRLKEDGIAGGVGLLERDTGLHAADDLKPHHAGDAGRIMEAVAAGPSLGLHGDGNPEVGDVADVLAEEARGGDADHGENVTVQMEGAAHHAGIAIEAAIPIAVVHDRNRIGAFADPLARIEGSAAVGGDAEDLEVVGADELGFGLLGGGGLAGLGPVNLVAAGVALRREQAGEDGVVIAEGKVFGVGEQAAGAVVGAEVGALLGGVGEDGQLLGVGNRKRSQQGGVNQAEDGGVRAYAEGQGEQRHGGEAGGLEQHAEGVAEVGEHGYWTVRSRDG